MAKIVILGAGIGGVSLAYELKSRLKEEHQITVIHERDYFQFVPSNVAAGIGLRKREEITIPLSEYFKTYGIEFIPHRAVHIDPIKQAITVSNVQEVTYDFLVIATGPKLNFEAIPGLGPEAGHTQSICTIDHAEKTNAIYQRFLTRPGPVVIGSAQGASCFGPAYEFCFTLNTELRKRKIRDQVPITFITSEPYIGHLGLGGVNDSKNILESELRKADVKYLTNVTIHKINEHEMEVDVFENGQHQTQQLPFDFSMIIPSFKGVDVVSNVSELCNPKGFVLIDEYQRSIKYNNIYAIGVCTAITPIEKTPVPTGIPKTGYMIESMVSATAENIAAQLSGKTPQTKPTLSAICLADFGNEGVAFVASPQIPPRNVSWAKKGKWVHLAKNAFEKYFLYKVKHGISEPVYEKYILHMLGLDRLK